MTTSRSGRHSVSSTSTSATTSLECVRVSKSFGGVHAIRDLTLSFQSGMITALVGPNGAGKTTLFHVISGLIAPDSGDILYRGRSLIGLRPWAISRLGVGRLFQDVRLFPRLTVAENIAVALPDEGFSGSSIRGLVKGSQLRRRQRDVVSKCLEAVGLLDHLEVTADRLSFGQQKLVAIARLLAADSDVLLLDEPAAGVSPAIMAALLAVLRDLAARGRAVALIEHALNVVQEVADTVLFIDEGRLLISGPPAEVFRDLNVRARYVGM